MADTDNQSRTLRVFLCHSSADKPAVRELYRRLQADSFDPWLDEEDLIPGQDWQHEIPKAVKNSDVVIVCLSRGSVNKAGYIQKEIKFALDVADEQPEDTIFIIPLKLEECKVPERLSRWQWVNYFAENGYSKLLRALHARAGSLQIGTAPVHAEVINQSGGVSVESGQVSVGQDIVGRDKVVQYIEHYHPPSNTQGKETDVLQNTKASDLSDRILWISLGVTILIGLLIGVPLAYNLFSGRAVVIPYAAPTNTPTPPKIFVSTSPATPMPTNLRKYTVQVGDTMSEIARKFDVSVADIMAINNLSNDDALSEGQVLLIPGSPLTPVPTRVPIPTSTRAPLPVITGTAPVALGDFFVTIREIKAPGSLADEQVILTNLSGQVNMAGWTMTDGEGNQFTFPNLSLLPKGEVIVHTGRGTDIPTDLYWGQAEPRWASGKMAYLRDPSGKLIATYQVP